MDTLSLKRLSQALGEWDFAMRASSYGANGSREAIANAIKNLPTPELEIIRPFIAKNIKDAVARTSAVLLDLGVILDEPHPARIRAAIDDPGSFFFHADRVR